jgi:F0F1-type ATP synthase assembly protein I
LGIQLVASVAGFAFMGQWLDRRLGTEGIMTIVGGLLGFGGTMWSLIRSLRKDQEQDR